jgi:hypothetical protein
MGLAGTVSIGCGGAAGSSPDQAFMNESSSSVAMQDSGAEAGEGDEGDGATDLCGEPQLESVALGETTRAGYSGAALLAEAEAWSAGELEWPDGSVSGFTLEIASHADVATVTFTEANEQGCIGGAQAWVDAVIRLSTEDGAFDDEVPTRIEALVDEAGDIESVSLLDFRWIDASELQGDYAPAAAEGAMIQARFSLFGGEARDLSYDDEQILAGANGFMQVEILPAGWTCSEDPNETCGGSGDVEYLLGATFRF